MAKDIKLYKDGHEVIINETQLENFIALGYKREQDKQDKPKKENKKSMFSRLKHALPQRTAGKHMKQKISIGFSQNRFCS